MIGRGSEHLEQWGERPRLLIYRFGHIGDTIASLPSLWALRTHFGNAHFTLLSALPSNPGRLPPEEVLPREGLVQKSLKYRGGADWRNVLSLGRCALALRHQRYRTLAYLVPSVRRRPDRRRDRLFFRLAGVTSFLGMTGFPEDPFPRTANLRPVLVSNEADALLHRLGLSGVSIPEPGEGRMDLGLTNEERLRIRQWWQQKGYRGCTRNRWFALGVGAMWESKRWPVGRYLEVGRRLRAELGLVPVVVGGREDREIGSRLAASWKMGLCAAGELSVRESAALLEGCSFYLGNDTGPMHLAAAVGRPCVGVFSAQDWPGRWHPYGQGHQVLRSDPPCAGCRLPVCSRHLRCLTDISVDAVYRACLEVLNKTAGSRPVSAAFK